MNSYYNFEFFDRQFGAEVSDPGRKINARLRLLKVPLAFINNHKIKYHHKTDQTVACTITVNSHFMNTVTPTQREHSKRWNINGSALV